MADLDPTLLLANSLRNTSKLGIDLSNALEHCGVLLIRCGAESCAKAINSTASDLKLLGDAILEDKLLSNNTTGFSDAGRQEVKFLAYQCERLYAAIILLVQRCQSQNFDPLEEKDMAELAVPLDPELNFCKSVSRVRQLDGGWFRDRAALCADQLEWLSFILKRDLHLFKWSRLQNSPDGRHPGQFEEEYALRVLVTKLNRSLRTGSKDAVKALDRQEKRENKFKPPPPPPPAPAPADSPICGSEVSRGDTGSGSNTHVGSEPPSRTSTPKPKERPSNPSPPVVPASPPGPPAQSPASPGDVDRSVLPVQGPAALKPDVQKKLILERVKLAWIRSATLGSRAKFQGETLHPGIPMPPKPAASFSISLEPQPLCEPPPGVISSLTSLASRIFGSKDVFIDDYPSAWLEAFVVHEGLATFKVPFGHQQLEYGLRKALKGKTGKQWDQYINMSPELRRLAMHVRMKASNISHHERTCLAIEQCKGAGGAPFVIFFFSLGEVKEPVQLFDLRGRTHVWPYESCRPVSGNLKQLIETCHPPPEPQSFHIKQGHFLLVDDRTGMTAHSDAWGTLVKPGSRLSIRLTSVPPHLQQRPNRCPPPGWLNWMNGVPAPAPPQQAPRRNVRPFIPPRWSPERRKEDRKKERRNQRLLNPAPLGAVSFRRPSSSTYSDSNDDSDSRWGSDSDSSSSSSSHFVSASKLRRKKRRSVRPKLAEIERLCIVDFRKVAAEQENGSSSVGELLARLTRARDTQGEVDVSDSDDSYLSDASSVTSIISD